MLCQMQQVWIYNTLNRLYDLFELYQTNFMFQIKCHIYYQDRRYIIDVISLRYSYDIMYLYLQNQK